MNFAFQFSQVFLWIFLSTSILCQDTGSLPVNNIASIGHGQADTLQIIWKEDFSNGIPSTWKNEVFDSSGNLYSLAKWEYRGANTSPSLNIGSRGAYSNPSNYIHSPSRENGFIIFDADYLDNRGQKENWGNGIAPAPHIGVLTTANIDITSATQPLLIFNSRFRKREGRALLCISTDNGNSWPDTIELHKNLQAGQIMTGNNQQIIDLSEIVGSATNAKLQFIFNGRYDDPDILGNAWPSYYWMLDDLFLISKPDYLLELNNNSISHAKASKHFPLGILNYLQPRRNTSKLHTITNISNKGKLSINHFHLSTNLYSRNNSIDTLSKEISIPPDTQIVIAQSHDLSTANYGYYFISQRLSYDSVIGTIPTIISMPDTIYPHMAFGLSSEKQTIANENWTGQKGSGYADRFIPAQDGARFANVMYVETADVLTKVKVFIGDSTKSGGDVFIEIKDTMPEFKWAFDSAKGGDWYNVLLKSDPYRITEEDIDKGYFEIEIPEVLTGGGVQDRELAPGLYYVSVSLFSNSGRNPITILENNSMNQGKFASIYYHYPKGRWYTDGNAMGIMPIFGGLYHDKCFPQTHQTTDTICSEESYYFQGNYLTEEGNYKAKFIDSEGCDSLVELSLRVYDAIPVSHSAVLCQEDTFRIGDTSFTTSGNYEVVIEKSNACDTNYILSLNFVDSLQIDSTVYFCESDSTFINGKFYSEEGIYNLIYPSQKYCDTVVKLKVIELASDTSIELEGKILIINLDTDFDKVEWIDCNTGKVLESTSFWSVGRSFKPSNSGKYKAKIYKKDCVFETPCKNVTFTGINVPTQDSFELWPNPTSKSVNLNFKAPEKRTITLTDLAGRQQLKKYSLGAKTNIDVSNLSSGIYFIKIFTSGGETYIRKVMIE